MSPTAARSTVTCLTVATLILAAGLVPAAAQSPAPFVSQALAEIEAVAGGPVDATVSPSTGLLTFLAARPGYPIPGKLPASVSTEAQAIAFLESHGAAFGIVDAGDLSLRRVSPKDEVGMEHVRFRQTYRGVPVTGGELTVHLRGTDVVAVNAKTLSGPEGLDVEPVLGALEARAAVRLLLAENLGITDAELSEPRLEVLNRGLLEGRSDSTRLAWFVEARRTDLREFVWVDATIGKALLRFSQLTDARTRMVHDTASSSTLPGPLARSEGGAATGDADVDAAYDFSGDTYDYFFNEHGRDSYDDAGATIVSTVDYCPSPASCPYANAFWSGTQMVYGAGFPAADDVDAHELTHAVTEYTANLYYYMQSGALNESFSDIFGETVDLTNSGGTDTPAVRWQMGEDVPGIGAIRDMMDPTVFGDPGKQSDAQFVCGDPGSDNGGVHSNSGVPNHAYALMVDGGSYNGFTVTGIGLTKAGKIQYRSLSYYLLSASDFLDNFNALKQSCQDLIGVAGITAADCTEVGNALDAVEMSSVWPCAPTQAAMPAFCSAGEAPSLFHHEDFESFGVPGCPAATVPTAWCTNQPSSLLGAYATSGVQSIWGYNRPTAGTMSISTLVPGTLPAGARMQFNHAFGFENSGIAYYDGGVIEYSTDSGASWSDAGSLITAGQAYGGTVNNCCSNPLSGQSAFVRETWGFTASQLDLSALGGGSFGYRFKVGTDTLFDDRGWFVDDVRIYSCAACLTDRVLDHTYNGTASLYQASNSVTAGSGFTVGLNESVTFDAGSFIVLESDFTVTDGGQFTARSTPGICVSCTLGTDSDGDRLDNCYETNTGVFVSATDTGTDPNNDDTDGDSLLDGDEVLGTLAGLDLPGLGTNPLRQNILLEYDWFDESLDCAAHSHRPTAAAIAAVSASFAGSPVVNPDGSTGITMIHDYGQGGLMTGGTVIPDADGVLVGGVNAAEFQAHKVANFAANRNGYFHYTILPHRYNTTSGSSGQAELPGDDLIVSLQCFLSTTNIANTIQHELGHNLLLRHGGFENCNYKPNYNSVMNYQYQFPGVDNDCTPPGNGVLDYSVGNRIVLTESNLNENLGICGAPAWDWDQDMVIEASVSVDINAADTFQAANCGGTLTVLQDFDDWANLDLTGLLDGDGAPVFKEIIDCDNRPPEAGQ